MINGVVLNHHSLPYSNIHDADNGFLFFLKVLKTCRKAGLSILLLDDDQDKTLMRLELSKEYFVSDWFKVSVRNPLMTDWCRLLRLIETKQPMFEKLDVEQVCENIEVGLHGDNTGRKVLLAAYYFKTFLTSFSAIEKWVSEQISVWVLDVSEGNEIKEDFLLNLVDDQSLKAHGEKLTKKRNELTNSAKDIWKRRYELYPSITLQANQIGTSLQNWSARVDVLIKARDSLNVFEEFCLKWQHSNYKEYRHEYLRELGLASEVSGESVSVNNNFSKKRERMFWLDNGQEVYCENHVKLPDGFRLHFYPDPMSKRIFVTYLGPHLSL